jgi:hypothetical protein
MTVAGKCARGKYKGVYQAACGMYLVPSETITRPDRCLDCMIDATEAYMQCLDHAAERDWLGWCVVRRRPRPDAIGVRRCLFCGSTFVATRRLSAFCSAAHASAYTAKTLRERQRLVELDKQ